MGDDKSRDRSKSVAKGPRKSLFYPSAPNLNAPKGPEPNTYQLKPSRIFKPNKAYAILNSLIEEHLAGKQYSCSLMRHLCRKISQQAKIRLAMLGYKRYKICVLVVIGQSATEPGFIAATRCLWDARFDNYATVSVHNQELFAFVSAYFVYFS